MTRAWLFVAAIVAGAGCAPPGVGPAVHNDLVAQLSTAQPQLSACYAQALARRGDARGMMVMAFATAPDTGQLVDIVVQRDETRDPALRQCVIATLAQLHLAAPTPNRVAWPRFPIRFTAQ